MRPMKPSYDFKGIFDNLDKIWLNNLLKNVGLYTYSDSQEKINEFLASFAQAQTIEEKMAALIRFNRGCYRASFLPPQFDYDFAHNQETADARKGLFAHFMSSLDPNMSAGGTVEALSAVRKLNWTEMFYLRLA